MTCVHSSPADSQLVSASHALDNGLSTFSSVVQYYCVQPGVGQEEVTPAQFFGLWFPFVRAFRDQWTKEQRSVAQRRWVEAHAIDLVHLEPFLLKDVCELIAWESNCNLYWMQAKSSTREQGSTGSSKTYFQVRPGENSDKYPRTSSTCDVHTFLLSHTSTESTSEDKWPS